MKKLTEKFKILFKGYVLFLIGAFLAVLMFNVYLYMVVHYPELTALPYRLTMIFIGWLLIRFVQKSVMIEVNDTDLVKQNPVAYALHNLPYAILVLTQLYLV